MYRILIAGAGYAGSAIARFYRSQNQKVWALCRTENKRQALERDGVSFIQADLANSETLVHIPRADFIVLSAAPDHREHESYRRLYVDGTAHFLTAVGRNPRPLLLVYLSSVGVWGDRKGQWLDETAPPDSDSERQCILTQAEKLVLNAPFPTLVLRLGGIYGPERNRIEATKAGKWPQDEPDAYINLIHRDDIVGSLHFLFKHGEAGQIYLGVDDEPVRRSEFAAWLCNKLDRPVTHPPLSEVQVSGKRCSNAKLKKLGYTMKYPTFREGYGELL